MHNIIILTILGFTLNSCCKCSSLDKNEISSLSIGDWGNQEQIGNNIKLVYHYKNQLNDTLGLKLGLRVHLPEHPLYRTDPPQIFNFDDPIKWEVIINDTSTYFIDTFEFEKCCKDNSLKSYNINTTKYNSEIIRINI